MRKQAKFDFRKAYLDHDILKMQQDIYSNSTTDVALSMR